MHNSVPLLGGVRGGFLQTEIITINTELARESKGNALNNKTEKLASSTGAKAKIK